MRVSRALVATGVLVSCVLHCVLASAGGLNVTVTLRGKKYNLSGSTVADLQEQLAEQAGIAKDQQSVLFKSKLLSADDDLAAAGVSEGDTINVVPTKRPKSERAAAAAGSSGSSTVDKPAFPSMGGLGGLGGMGGMPGLPADMSPEEYQKMMAEVLNSPMMDEFFGSAEKIEESRKAILSNTMLKEAMSQLPGFTEMLEDPEKWQESMMQAKEMMESQRSMMQDGGGSLPGSSPLSGDVDDLDDE